MASLSDNVTTIPTDLYSWSGLPKESRNQLLGTAIPKLTESLEAYPGVVTKGAGAVSDIYSGMPGTIVPYMSGVMNQFKDTTQGAFQGTLNNLADRNVLGSQVTSDTLVNLGKALNKQNFADVSDVALQTQLASQQGLAETEAAKTDMLASYPNVLAQIIGQARSQENPFQPYQTMLDFILQV